MGTAAVAAAHGRQRVPPPALRAPCIHALHAQHSTARPCKPHLHWFAGAGALNNEALVATLRSQIRHLPGGRDGN